MSMPKEVDTQKTLEILQKNEEAEILYMYRELNETDKKSIMSKIKSLLETQTYVQMSDK